MEKRGSAMTSAVVRLYEMLPQSRVLRPRVRHNLLITK